MENNEKRKNMFEALDFYPTPKTLLDKIFSGFDWTKIETVLEPEAGKGDIAEYINERMNTRWGYSTSEVDIDCIEIDQDLRALLKGKGLKVVHDDFLTFHTFKNYDLIAMNPPFSNGAAHLMKALDMQGNGGGIVCILNAETLRNPYTNERKALVKRLSDLNAEITYMQEEFCNAEHPTNVEIAVVKVYVPKREIDSQFFQEMKKKTYAEHTEAENVTDITLTDLVKSSVSAFNIEVEAGIRLIQEYRAMKPYIMKSLKPTKYDSCILELNLHGGKALSVNQFVKAVRKKYWSGLFENERFVSGMTSNLREQYRDKVAELAEYDFSEYNIRTLMLDMNKNLIRGIEDCIIDMFEELSGKYHYSETSGNIHYYNGWKTNKAWIINKKVVVPWMDAWSDIFHDYDPTRYDVIKKLSDIEKALDYLDGGATPAGVPLYQRLVAAKKTGQTKKVDLKYFTVTFYKKGTCHIEFKDMELLKKLNIFGSQRKGWLPPDYGKMRYDDMTEEAQAVVNEFDGGKDSYDIVFARADRYLFDPADSVPLLETV